MLYTIEEREREKREEKKSKAKLEKSYNRIILRGSIIVRESNKYYNIYNNIYLNNSNYLAVETKDRKKGRIYAILVYIYFSSKGRDYILYIFILPVYYI